MTPPPDRLRDALRELADTAEPTDLYQRSVRRSRRIARREAAVGTGAALLALGLLASGLWRLPDRHGTPQVAGRSPSASPAGPASAPVPPPAAPERPKRQPRETTSSGPDAGRPAREPPPSGSGGLPRSRSLADLPGQIFYKRTGDRSDVVRLTPADGTPTTVLPDPPSAVGISPDGGRIAYVRDGKLLVTRTGDDSATEVAGGVATTAQAPAWSPDGTRLLVDAAAPAIVQVDSGTLTPLPEAVQGGRHFRWSGDGRKLVYATSYCGLQVAGTSGVTDTAVPGLGGTTSAHNPDGLAACEPTSVDVTGERVTVPLRVAGETGSARPGAADAVVDTITGAVVPLPVDGTVVGTVFGPDGHLLVRWVGAGQTWLSLFAPGGELLVRTREPRGLRDLDLLAYTH